MLVIVNFTFLGSFHLRIALCLYILKLNFEIGLVLFGHESNSRTSQNLCLTLLIQKNTESITQILFCWLLIYDFGCILWQLIVIHQVTTFFVFNFEMNSLASHHSLILTVPHIGQHYVIENSWTHFIFEQQLCVSVMLIIIASKLISECKKLFTLA